MIELGDLPHVNAILNTASACLLTAGYVLIRRGQVVLHQRCMLSAFVTSALFLACYLVYHVGRLRLTGSGHVEFRGTGAARQVYLTILVSHVLLAFTVLPLSLGTLWWGWRGRFDRHRRIARWTLPIWMYVSVTGVVVYWMLYQLSAQGPLEP